MKKYNKKEQDEIVSIYGGIEGHLLNTFFSGLYISSAELLKIGKEIGLNSLSMKNRELLIADILAESKRIANISLFAEKLSKLIDERIINYRELIETYPKGGHQLKDLIQKLLVTKRLILSRLRD